jgi:hypothetical protein
MAETGVFCTETADFELYQSKFGPKMMDFA